MARWRKVDLRMWGDARFRSLTPPPPNARDLFIGLLIGTRTTSLPGVVLGTPDEIASSLGWGAEGFREAFREAFLEVLTKTSVKADEGAGVVWLPNGVKYNTPQAPNVIISWRDTWDLIPECDLKAEIWEGLKAFTDGLGEGFRKAFRKAIPKPSEKSYPKVSRIQEQEQEQEDHTPTEYRRHEDASPRKRPHNGQKDLPLGSVNTDPDRADRGKVIWRVFCHWKDVFDQKDAFMDGSRSGAIKRALGWRQSSTGCGVDAAGDDLCAAIDAAKTDPWCNGQNRTGGRVDEIRSIVGSAPLLERLIRVSRGETVEPVEDDDQYPDLTFEGRTEQ